MFTWPECIIKFTQLFDSQNLPGLKSECWLSNGCSTWAKTASLLSLATLLFIAPQIFASDNPYLFDIRDNKESIGWLEGEEYDIFTGQMNHRMTDLHYPGNGIPITVNRTIHQGGSKRVQFDFPRLTFYSNETNDVPRGCSAGQYAQEDMKLSVDGQTISFFAASTKSNSADHFPVAARFISHDNWYIECDSSQYVAFAPSGYIYRFGYGYKHAIKNGLNGETRQIQSVEDTFGNKLHYTYTRYKAPIHPGTTDNEWTAGEPGFVKTIKSANRTVTFTVALNADLAGHDSNNYVVTSMSTNGSPNERRIKYKHTDYGYTVDVGEGRVYQYAFHFRDDSLLATIVYPEGGRVLYTYGCQGQTNCINYRTSLFQKGSNAYYKPLINRRVNDGQSDEANWWFSARRLQSVSDAFSRTITTPHNTLEYWYGQLTLAVNEEHGNLLKFKNYNHVAVNWDEYARAHLVTDFTYQKIYNISASVNTQSSNKIEKRSEITRVYESITSNNPIKFSRYYDWSVNSQFEEFFNLQRIRERSSDAIWRSTVYEYKNTSFGANWINGKISKQTIAGEVTSYKYFDNGAIDSVTDKGITTSYGYHSDGNLNWSKNASNDQYSYTDYYRGTPRVEIDEKGRRIARGVSSDGTISIESNIGNTGSWTYTYDKLHRIKSIAYPGGERQKTFFDYPSTRKTIERSADSRLVTEREYDNFGRLRIEATESKAPDWTSSLRTVVNEYDSTGRLAFTSLPSASNSMNKGDRGEFPGTVIGYDPMGRKTLESTAINTANGAKTINRQWEYKSTDSNYLRVIAKDGKGHKTTTAYRSFGSPAYTDLVQIIDGNNIKTDYELDSMGRVKSIKRAGQTRSYSYNWKKQLKNETHPETGITDYLYFPDGMIDSITSNGRTIRHEYNVANQLLKKTVTGSNGAQLSHVYEYDDNGRVSLTKSINADSTKNVNVRYIYDKLGNVQSETTTVAGRVYYLGFDYDKFSNLSTIYYPNLSAYELKPDSLGQSTAIENRNGSVIIDDIDYFPTGQYKKIRKGDNVIVSQSDAMFRLEDRKFYKNNSSNTTKKLNHHMKYEYDNNSNLTRISDSIESTSQRMAYDNGERLTSVSGNRIGSRSFQYDAHDNLKKRIDNGITYSYHYNASKNRLDKITSSKPERKYQYNAFGDVLSLNMYRSNSPDSVRELVLTRGPEGRVSQTNDGSKYAYNAKGLRVFKERNGKIFYIYDHTGKLRYRDDPTFGVKTEYFYVAGELIAKREVGSDGGVDGSFELDSPVGGDIASPVTFKWQPKTGAWKYRYELKAPNGDVLDFKGNLTAAELGCTVAGTTCSYSNSGIQLDAGATYTWRVRPLVNGAGDWSEYVGFTMRSEGGNGGGGGDGGDGGSFRIASPIGGGIATPVAFKWQPKTGAWKYRYELKAPNGDVLDFKGNLTAADLGCTAAGTTCSYSNNGIQLDAGATYNWRVRPLVNGVGDWSDYVSFTTNSEDDNGAGDGGEGGGSFKIDSPIGGGIDTPVTFKWLPKTGAGKYRYELKSPSGEVLDFRSSLTAADLGCTAAGTTCSYSNTGIQLNAGTAYTWRVRPLVNGVGDWSDYVSFTTRSEGGVGDAFKLNGPIGGGIATPVMFTWQPKSSASNYQYELKGPSGIVLDFKNNLSGAELGCAAGNSSCSYSNSGIQLNSGTAYTWRVRPLVNGAGDWSDYVGFITNFDGGDGSYELISPEGSITTRNPNFEWWPQSDANAYQFDLKNSSGGVLDYQDNLSKADLGCADGVSKCRYIKNDLNLPPGGGYTWRILPIGGTAGGSWSAGESFSVN